MVSGAVISWAGIVAGSRPRSITVRAILAARKGAVLGLVRIVSTGELQGPCTSAAVWQLSGQSVASAQDSRAAARQSASAPVGSPPHIVGNAHHVWWARHAMPTRRYASPSRQTACIMIGAGRRPAGHRLSRTVWLKSLPDNEL